MSNTNIVLPSLSQWTESHITAIYQATSPSNTSNALDNFLSKDAILTVNGNAISRSDLTKELQTEKFLEAGAIVTFLGIVEVPTNQTAPVEAGSVGTFYTATIQEAIRIRDAPVSNKVTASINVVIEQDPSIPLPPPSPIHGFSDRRRVKALNLVVIEASVPFGPI